MNELRLNIGKKKHKDHKSSVLQHSLSYFLFKNKAKQKTKEKEKTKKIVVTEKKVNHVNQAIFTSPLTFNRMNLKRLASTLQNCWIAMITQTQRHLEKHFSNDCRKVL